MISYGLITYLFCDSHIGLYAEGEYWLFEIIDKLNVVTKKNGLRFADTIWQIPFLVLVKKGIWLTPLQGVRILSFSYLAPFSFIYILISGYFLSERKINSFLLFSISLFSVFSLSLSFVVGVVQLTLLMFCASFYTVLTEDKYSFNRLLLTIFLLPYLTFSYEGIIILYPFILIVLYINYKLNGIYRNFSIIASSFLISLIILLYRTLSTNVSTVDEKLVFLFDLFQIKSGPISYYGFFVFFYLIWLIIISTFKFKFSKLDRIIITSVLSILCFSSPFWGPSLTEARSYRTLIIFISALVFILEILNLIDNDKNLLDRKVLLIFLTVLCLSSLFFNFNLLHGWNVKIRRLEHIIENNSGCIYNQNEKNADLVVTSILLQDTFNPRKIVLNSSGCKSDQYDPCDYFFTNLPIIYSCHPHLKFSALRFNFKTITDRSVVHPMGSR